MTELPDNPIHLIIGRLKDPFEHSPRITNPHGVACISTRNSINYQPLEQPAHLRIILEWQGTIIYLNQLWVAKPNQRLLSLYIGVVAKGIRQNKRRIARVHHVYAHGAYSIHDLAVIDQALCQDIGLPFNDTCHVCCQVEWRSWR